MRRRVRDLGRREVRRRVHANDQNGIKWGVSEPEGNSGCAGREIAG
jgi:hypothetical protein